MLIKKPFIFTILFIACFILLFAYFRNNSQYRTNSTAPTQGETLINQRPVVSKGEKYISGNISAVSDTQPVDGNCEVTVDNMQVAIAIGGDRMPTMIPKDKGMIEGITCNTNELSQYVGRYLEAYGKWNGYYLTVEGNTKYYIQVNPNSAAGQSPKLQICPESWSSNRMPCTYDKSPSECGPRDTFIINGQKFNETQIDVSWVKQNCSVKENVTY